MAGDTEAWYESHYAAQVRGGIRAPDLLRLLAGGPDAAAERSWQGATLHADILDALERAASDGIPRTVVDLGCGTGEVLDALTAAGWSAVGTEPATQLAELGRSLGRAIDTATAIDYLAGRRARGESPLGAILLLNVLEHVPEPWTMADEMVRVTRPGGTVFLSYTIWLSPHGGHETSPWHYLGGRRALQRYERTKGKPPKNVYGESMYAV
ncbi:MAG TPA: class I SAM-dependent methyltransferase, partial [Candidatus Limnocylindrales bacterium]|nr:class I SAM-dependent methyltransferase [Candidatus Limnocylindrales bacterium]